MDNREVLQQIQRTWILKNVRSLTTKDLYDIEFEIESKYSHNDDESIGNVVATLQEREKEIRMRYYELIRPQGEDELVRFISETEDLFGEYMAKQVRYERLREESKRALQALREELSHYSDRSYLETRIVKR